MAKIDARGMVVWYRGTYRRRRKGDRPIGKRGQRIAKKARMEKLYQRFLMQDSNEKISWLPRMHLRHYRDYILSQAGRQ